MNLTDSIDSLIGGEWLFSIRPKRWFIQKRNNQWVVESFVQNIQSGTSSFVHRKILFFAVFGGAKLINCQAIIVSVTLRKVIAHLINKFYDFIYCLFLSHKCCSFGNGTSNLPCFFGHDSVMIEKMQRLSLCFTKSNSKEFWTSVVNMPWNTSVEMLNLLRANGTEVNQKQHNVVINPVHLCFGLFSPKPCKKLISFSKSSCGHPNAMKTEDTIHPWGHRVCVQSRRGNLVNVWVYMLTDHRDS